MRFLLHNHNQVWFIIFFSICNAMLCNQALDFERKVISSVNTIVLWFLQSISGFFKPKVMTVIILLALRKPKHCTSLHSLVIFQHSALDTGWKLSYQFVNGVVMSLPEQKTVSIITCRFSIPSWKKSRIY